MSKYTPFSPRQKETAVVLGTFDGVHRGHAALLARAKESGLPVTAYTFSSSPRGSVCLTTPEERERLLRLYGADEVIFADFTSIRSLSPEAFVEQILLTSLGASRVICGFNYRFGQGAKGDCKLLRTLLSEHGAKLDVVQAVQEDGEPISSTRIRDLLARGNPQAAERLLGRPFSYRLPIEAGRRIGRTLGFPTANQRIPRGLISLPSGVYATSVTLGERSFAAVSNIGSRPTVNSDPSDITCETHLIGFEGDLYGQTVEVCFHVRLRNEIRFRTPSELRAQIEKDTKAAICLLSDRFKGASEKGRDKQ